MKVIWILHIQTKTAFSWYISKKHVRRFCYVHLSSVLLKFTHFNKFLNSNSHWSERQCEGLCAFPFFIFQAQLHLLPSGSRNVPPSITRDTPKKKNRYKMDGWMDRLGTFYVYSLLLVSEIQTWTLTCQCFTLRSSCSTEPF